MAYDKNEKLSTLIQGKRVALVGPSSHLMGEGLGPIIDNYDVVCRVNYLIARDFIADYGKKIDVFFYNCCTRSLGQMKEHFKKCAGTAKNVKVVICPVVKVLGPEEWTKWDLDYVSPVVSNFASVNIHNLDFHWIGIKNYRYLFNLIDCQEPNTGPLAMAIILEHNPEELFITGFSFYDSNCKAHFDNYPLLPPDWKGYCGHPQPLQIDFFKKYVLQQKGVKIDSYLDKLLQANHHNVQMLKK